MVLSLCRLSQGRPPGAAAQELRRTPVSTARVLRQPFVVPCGCCAGRAVRRPPVVLVAWEAEQQRREAEVEGTEVALEGEGGRGGEEQGQLNSLFCVASTEPFDF